MELAAAWAAAGYRVRVIDGDQQEAALSAWLLPQYPEGSPRHSLRSVFFEDCTLPEAAYPTLFAGVDVVPSGTDLQWVEYERPIGAEQALAAALAPGGGGGRRSLPVRRDPDRRSAVPRAGHGAPSRAAVAVLTAADEVLVPIKVGGLDMKGMASLHRTIRSVQRNTNPKLRVGAVLLTT